MKIRDNFVGVLANTGTLASFYGLHENAQVILEGVRAVRPDNHYASISLAVTKINAYLLNEAIVILRDWVLKIDPGSLAAKCYLGLALKYSGHNHEGDGLLREVIETADDDDINEKRLAKELLKCGDVMTGSPV